MQFTLFLVAVVANFLLAAYQCRRLSGSGSDHHVHLFLASVIRENGHRLFTRVPRILNPAYCSAYPLFMHWILSFLSPRQIRSVSVYLNPATGSLSIAAVYLALRHDPALAGVSGWISLCYGLTPQHFHFSNARIWGLSGRSTGLFLFLVFSLLASAPLAADRWPAAAGAIFVGYLIFGFNAFAQQTMVLFALFRGLIFRDWHMALLAAASVIVFLALHPRYASSYLKHTFHFIRTYATDVADAFILEHRHSVWRDLIYDIWGKMSQSLKDVLPYAYNNSVLIVVLLNPLSWIGVLSWAGATGATGGGGLGAYAREMVLVALMVFLATSFRATRFLGEPERYVEMASAYSAIAAVTLLASLAGTRAIAWTTAILLLMVLAQIAMSGNFSRREVGGGGDLPRIRQAIDRQVAEHVAEHPDRAGQPVRFASNSEVLTSFMMNAPYHFIRVLWSPEQALSDMTTAEACRSFPFILHDAFERILVDFRIDFFVLDKAAYDQVFEAGDEGPSPRRLLETEQYVLFHIDWQESDATADS